MAVKSLLFITYIVCCFSVHSTEKIMYETTKIVDNVYSFKQVEGEYYSMFIVTDEGVIAIEPVSSNHSTNMLLSIKNVTEKPIKYMIASHNHWDHSNGLGVFEAENATTLAHAEAYEYMEANIGPDLQLPTEKWEGKRKDIVLGNTTLELHYLGMNHGQGMTVFLLPKERIAYISDIAVPYRVLFNICPDFNYKEQLRSLKEIMLLDFDRAVFTHNYLANASHGGHKDDVKQQIEFMEELKAEIYKMLMAGLIPAMDIPKNLTLPKYKDWFRYDDWLAMNAWFVFLSEWMGSNPWHKPYIAPTTVPITTTTPAAKCGSPLFTVSLELFIGTLFSYVILF